MRSSLYTLAKVLEGLGLIVILVGLMISVQMGMNDETMKSMYSEAYGLLVGAGLFGAGWLLERIVGTR